MLLLLLPAAAATHNISTAAAAHNISTEARALPACGSALAAAVAQRYRGGKVASPRSPTRAVRLCTNPGTNILLLGVFITAVGPPAVLTSLKPLNNIIQLPLHVPCIVSNNYTAIVSG